MEELVIPEGHGLCPVCKGAKVIHDPRPYQPPTRQCGNCGGQFMFGEGKGYVRLNRNGEPCHHEYTSHERGRCYRQYTCKHCGLSFDVDSGD